MYHMKIVLALLLAFCNKAQSTIVGVYEGKIRSADGTLVRKFCELTRYRGQGEGLELRGDLNRNIASEISDE